MKPIYDALSRRLSKITTCTYSTSFSMGIRLLNKRFHYPIYSIYGFVRLADEIVDSFHEYDKEVLLRKFKEDTYDAIERGISLNPILNSFQEVVRTYEIDLQLVEQFLKSMEMDLSEISYDQRGFEEYILGSAEVVGLMCLYVFTEGDHAKYASLKEPAMRLGSAFQKINFLRDIRADYLNLGRSYFPNLDFNKFSEEDKKHIEQDIEEDFKAALEGIKRLPVGARLGVYTAYVYYMRLFQKIRGVRPERILDERIRVPNWQKLLLTMRCLVSARLGMY